jgi:hypothetical protein
LWGAAVAELEALRSERTTLRQEGLMESYLYWMTRARDEGQGNPDAALNFLVEQDLQDLASTTIVERLMQATERAASRSAADRLERTRTLLRQLDDGDETPWIPARRARIEEWALKAQQASGAPQPIVATEEPAKQPPPN